MSTRSWSTKVLFFLLATLVWISHAHAELKELTQAHAHVTVNEVTTEREAQLPYNWDIQTPGQPGEASFDIPFELPTPVSEPWGVYLPSVGNAYAIWLNGALLQRQGDLLHGNGSDYAKVPRFLVIAPDLLRASNLLRVQIRVDAERRGGLSELWVGPEEEAYAAYRRSYHWRVNGSLVVLAFSLAVGLLALGLWATQVDLSHAGQARRDPIYLYAAMAELCWTVAVGDALIETPPLTWLGWSGLTAAAGAAWACNMQLFCIEVAGWRQRRFVPAFRTWLTLLIGLSVALPIWAAAGEHAFALVVWHTALAVTFLGFGAVFLYHAKGSAVWPHRLVAFALLFNLMVGIRDLWSFRIMPSFPDNSMLRFSSLLFGFSLAAIVIARFRAASHQAKDLMVTMSERISENEAALRASYDKLDAQTREQERSAERARILRDMHDGVGSHISLAIRQLQGSGPASGQHDPSEVLLTLRDALDQLKLSIDAINLPPGDVTALLANLRYRLEPRLASSGIELQWNVDLLPVVARLDSVAMRHLQFMLFEALSNVVQHAMAQVLRIEAHVQDPANGGASAPVHIRVIDDGRGFDVQHARRKGLAAMHDRAASIGAQLCISSQPGRSMVEISLT